MRFQPLFGVGMLVLLVGWVFWSPSNMSRIIGDCHPSCGILDPHLRVLSLR